MSNLILSINAGSSSLKVSVFTTYSTPPKQLAEIQATGLTAPPVSLKWSCKDQQEQKTQLENVKTAQDAYQKVLDTLIADENLPELKSADDITHACHRIVHGGDYHQPVRIDKDTLHHLQALSDLAPLHNAGALEIVEAVHNACPKATNIAFFDSAFHATIPEAAYTYAINQEIAKKNKLRKYGFHGLSYAFITRECTSYLLANPKETNLIVLHLGSGASICCIQGGKSVDTSMGLTPLAGLPGATRSGDIDPSLIFHFTHDAGKLSSSSTKELHITQAEQILNKESGWKAMTGTTDFGDITSRAASGDAACKLAFDIFVDRIAGYIGSYFVRLGGEVDALVFAGGIGEKSAPLREAVMNKVKFLGFIPDLKANEKGAGEKTVADVGYYNSQHRILICQTDEQTEMARQCTEGKF